MYYWKLSALSCLDKSLIKNISSTLPYVIAARNQDGAVMGTPPSRTSLSVGYLNCSLYMYECHMDKATLNMDHSEETTGKSVDIYRDTWVRFLGTCP